MISKIFLEFMIDDKIYKNLWLVKYLW
jgi:hypothetical protein